MKTLRNFAKYCDIILTFIPIFIVSPATSKEYRTDYVYNRKSDAFYKFHMEYKFHQTAKDICEFEGATLMVPSSDEDLAQAHGMFKQYPDISDLAWIGSDGDTHDSIEASSLVAYYIHSDMTWFRSEPSHEYEFNVISRTGEAQRVHSDTLLPFICKVDAKDAYVDEKCNVFSTGYTYFENVGSCYRIPGEAFQWNYAYSECRAQGAHLVVLNSELEHQVVRNLTNAAPAVKNAYVHHLSYFYAGIRADPKSDSSPLVFKTIFNQTMEEAGYSQWSANEPNNAEGREFCVTIFRVDGNYNDIFCEDMLGFICEKEVKNSEGVVPQI